MERYFNTKWIVWTHELDDQNWEIDSYTKYYEIETIKDFWSIMNNLKALKLYKKHIYLMKDGIEPIWEDPQNINGGTCTLKIELKKSLNVIENLSCHVFTDNLLINSNSNIGRYGINNYNDDINGISFSPKITNRNSALIIKIWNKTYDINISRLFKQEIADQYSDISILYRKNK